MNNIGKVDNKSIEKLSRIEQFELDISIPESLNRVERVFKIYIKYFTVYSTIWEDETSDVQVKVKGRYS